MDRQVRIIGEATDPSAMPYRDGMTLLDVMIATKGLTKFAAGNRAMVIRRGPDGTSQSIPVRLSDLIKDGDNLGACAGRLDAALRDFRWGRMDRVFAAYLAQPAARRAA